MLNRANITLYGKGIFTTISFGDFGLFVWEKHWRRLTADAGKIGIDTSEFNGLSIKDSVSRAVRESRLANGRIRVAFLDESATRLWGGDEATKTRLSIITGDRRPVTQAFKLAVSPHRINTTSPLVGVKSCNYLDPLLTLGEAKGRGFDEAIRINDSGAVTSACMANVFWLKNGRLHTPSLKTGCLPGTTREFVIENLESAEVCVGIDALNEADEIFLTSAGIGVVQAAEFDGRKLRRSEHPIKSVLPF